MLHKVVSRATNTKSTPKIKEIQATDVKSNLVIEMHSTKAIAIGKEINPRGTIEIVITAALTREAAVIITNSVTTEESEIIIN